MIINILSIVLFVIFSILGSIHFYWAFGGEWAIKNAIPTKEENEDLTFRPSAFATFLVGVILILFACFYINQTDYISFKIPKWTNSLLWILPSLFLIRAIGDFKYVGFFKNIKNTTFAKWDAKLYAPLCLFISILGFIIANAN